MIQLFHVYHTYGAGAETLVDVTLEIQKGEFVYVTGPSGAGKTTLLRLLNGLIRPDAGAVTVRGRVGALIALGAGFNPVLTGRENVYINAAVLGFSRRETDAMLEAVVDFAGIGAFIDTPVRHYSSGMTVRLGFAVASQLDPDVLLVDEVLAVGDYAFREKSFTRIGAVCRRGAAVVLISHNMAAITALCHRVLWLREGRTERVGPTEAVVPAYLREEVRRAAASVPPPARATPPADPRMTISEVALLDPKGRETDALGHDDDLVVDIRYTASAPLDEVHFVVQVKLRSEVLFCADMFRQERRCRLSPGEGRIRCRFSAPRLLPNTYAVDVLAFGATPVHKLVYPAWSVFFRVAPTDAPAGAPSLAAIRNAGAIAVPARWFPEEATIRP